MGPNCGQLVGQTEELLLGQTLAILIANNEVHLEDHAGLQRDALVSFSCWLERPKVPQHASCILDDNYEDSDRGERQWSRYKLSLCQQLTGSLRNYGTVLGYGWLVNNTMVKQPQLIIKDLLSNHTHP